MYFLLKYIVPFFGGDEFVHFQWVVKTSVDVYQGGDAQAEPRGWGLQRGRLKGGGFRNFPEGSSYYKWYISGILYIYILPIG